MSLWTDHPGTGPWSQSLKNIFDACSLMLAPAFGDMGIGLHLCAFIRDPGYSGSSPCSLVGVSAMGRVGFGSKFMFLGSWELTSSSCSHFSPAILVWTLDVCLCLYKMPL